MNIFICHIVENNVNDNNNNKSVNIKDKKQQYQRIVILCSLIAINILEQLSASSS